MFDWWRKRKAKQDAIAQSEERMVEALAELEEVSIRCKRIEIENLDEVDIADSIADATDKAAHILKPERATNAS